MARLINAEEGMYHWSIDCTWCIEQVPHSYETHQMMLREARERPNKTRLPRAEAHRS